MMARLEAEVRKALGLTTNAAVPVAEVEPVQAAAAGGRVTTMPSAADAAKAGAAKR